MKGRSNLASAARNAKCKKHLSRARQWALVDRGEGGGEREEREGESTDKYTQVQTRHNKTQNTREEEEYYKGRSGKILRSVKAAVRIFLKVEGRDQYIQ